MKTNQGQTTLELILTGTLILISVAGGGHLFKVVWQRGKCAYLVFEKTRSLLSSPQMYPISPTEISTSPGFSFQWFESDQDLVGRGRCGKLTERVGFQKLEDISKWEP